jgi:hypothetical protein
VKRALAFAAVLTLGAGCVGHITGGGGDDDGPSPDDPRNLCESGEADVAGPRLLRRLTTAELAASVRYAFDLPFAEWSGPSVPADAAGRNGFTNNVDRLVVDEGYAAALLTTAESVADAVVAPGRLPFVLPCAASGGESCANTYLDTIGRRLYRRPLTADERARYLALHARIIAEDDFATWVRWATVAMVQSPNFLYRSELGERRGDTYQLTGYELATALAFDFTGAPPTDALLDAAARGDLDAAAGLSAAAHDLAIDPATGAVRPAMRAQFLAFADQWLALPTLDNLVKNGEAFPGFTEQIRASMAHETEDFLSHVVLDERGGIADLLTSTESVVDPALAGYYGWPATANGEAVRPDGWGVGLLAQGSLLAINAGNTFTSPTRRGKLVRERFLCGDIPPPPPVVGDIPPSTGADTTRQRYEAHSANSACSGCHQMMDPIGFAFEHLDAGGKYREQENGFPIDATGKLAGFTTAAGAPVTFDGPVELASALAAQPETSACVASFLASHAYGLDHHDTSCLVSSLSDQLARGDIGLLDFYLALTTTKHFTQRVD